MDFADDFDAILGQLDNLGKQFEFAQDINQNNFNNKEDLTNFSNKLENRSSHDETKNKKIKNIRNDNLHLNNKKTSALKEFSFINSQLADVLNDLAFLDEAHPETHNAPEKNTVPEIASNETNQAEKEQEEDYEGDFPPPPINLPIQSPDIISTILLDKNPVPTSNSSVLLNQINQNTNEKTETFKQASFNGANLSNALKVEHVPNDSLHQNAQLNASPIKNPKTPPAVPVKKKPSVITVEKNSINQSNITQKNSTNETYNIKQRNDISNLYNTRDEPVVGNINNDFIRCDEIQVNQSEVPTLSIVKENILKVSNSLQKMSENNDEFIPNNASDARRTSQSTNHSLLRNEEHNFSSMKNRNDHRTSSVSSNSSFSYTKSIISSTSTDSGNCEKTPVKEKSTIQACVNVVMLDGKEKCLYVTSETTIAQLREHVVKDHLILTNKNSFTFWEVQSDLFIERCLNDDQLVLNDVVDSWPKKSKNQLVMRATPPKKTPSTIKSDVESNLHVKLEDKKSWKCFSFVLKNDGFYYYPKEKGKASCQLQRYHPLDPTTMKCFDSIGWKKKFKAPSEFGFAIKTTGSESMKDFKMFCTENESVLTIWMAAIAEILKTRNVDECSDQSIENKSVCSSPSINHDLNQKVNSNMQPSRPLLQRHFSERRPSTFSDDLNLYSEPYENYQNGHQRKFSNTSSTLSKNDFEIGMVSPSLKKVANLPITTGTTKLLQSMHQTNLNPYMTLPKDFNKEEIKRKIQNDYTPSPTHQKSHNLLKTLPKPVKAKPSPKNSPIHNNYKKQLSALPLSDCNTQSYNTLPSPSKSRALPPVPPKRDQSTKLSNQNISYNTIKKRNTYDVSNSDNNYYSIPENNYNTYNVVSHYDTPAKVSKSPQHLQNSQNNIPPKPYSSQLSHNYIQTQNFLMNMNRTLGQKRNLGVDGLQKMVFPLVSPPSFSSPQDSYLETGSLPPPPAELLSELKHMETRNSRYDHPVY